MASDSNRAIESYKKAITTAASLAASVMLARSVVSELLPDEVREVLFSGLSYLRSRMSSEHTLVIEESEVWSNNHVYNAVQAYLEARIDTNMQRLRVSGSSDAQSMVMSMEESEQMADIYDGTEFKWRLVVSRNTSTGSSGNGDSRHEVRSFEVWFPKKHKEKALKSYLPFIVATANAMKDKDRTLKIHMPQYDVLWCSYDLRHPSTFDTLAMDQKLKQSIMDDLERFLRRKDYYRRIGKAWKRGYLLYGPPGTGKSSLIAAMANHLMFDIYDLELTEVKCNSDLRKLLAGMANRSILVVEDIDCTIDLTQRGEGEERAKSSSTGEDNEDKVTLSGMLNFVDGLWSASGEERIIVFTTNHKERLDQALLRPGRMDMHIYMGYCTPESFRILAKNYHSIDYHVAYQQIEELIKAATVTPAEVAEVLMRYEDTEVALQGLVEFLNAKKKYANEIKTGNEGNTCAGAGEER